MHNEQRGAFDKFLPRACLERLLKFWVDESGSLDGGTHAVQQRFAVEDLLLDGAVNEVGVYLCNKIWSVLHALCRGEVHSGEALGTLAAVSVFTLEWALAHRTNAGCRSLSNVCLITASHLLTVSRLLTRLRRRPSSMASKNASFIVCRLACFLLEARQARRGLELVRHLPVHRCPV